MNQTSKSVLVTGADGFIGRRLVPQLEERGCMVIGLTIEDYDICSPEIKKIGPIDHVFHLAALTSVPQSWEAPFEYYRVNALGTENILELCREQGSSLTFMSTYIYGQPQYSPVDEKHPLAPNSPYNHSKYLAEQLCEFFYRQFGVDSTVFRPFNIYGEGQADSFLIPTIVRQLLDEGTKEITLKSLTPKRDYFYVDDMIEALLLSMEKTKGYEVYNLSSGNTKSVQEIVGMLMSVSGIEKKVVSEGIERSNEVTDICGSAAKAKELLGWAPKFGLREGLSRTIGGYL